MKQPLPSIVKSSLSREVQVDGHKFRLEIYRRRDDMEWMLEISHRSGNALTWADTFASEWVALNQGLSTIREEGVDLLVNRVPES